MRKLTAIIAFIAASALFSQTVYASVVHWRVQSNQPQSSALFQLEQAFADDVARLTNNQLIIAIRPPEGYVSIRASFSSVRTHQIEGMFMNPIYWTSADPIFAILGDLVTAWDTPEQYYDWLENDNGIQYLEDAYQDFGLRMLGFIISPSEALASNVPLRNIADLSGQRIRTPPGMTADYFAALGAFPRQITLDLAIKAFKRKQVNIIDFADIVMNYKGGIYEFAKHTNYPGFHSLPIIDFVVSEQAWQNLLAEHRQAVLQAIKRWQVNIETVYYESLDETLTQLKQQGVTIHNWDAQERLAARKLAIPVWQKYAKKSPKAQQALNSMMKKLKEIGNL